MLPLRSVWVRVCPVWPDEAHDELFQRALRKIERINLRGSGGGGGDDRPIPISQFVEFARQSPSLLFPAFRVQQKVRPLGVVLCCCPRREVSMSNACA